MAATRPRAAPSTQARSPEVLRQAVHASSGIHSSCTSRRRVREGPGAPGRAEQPKVAHGVLQQVMSATMSEASLGGKRTPATQSTVPGVGQVDALLPIGRSAASSTLGCCGGVGSLVEPGFPPATPDSAPPSSRGSGRQRAVCAVAEILIRAQPRGARQVRTRPATLVSHSASGRKPDAWGPSDRCRSPRASRVARPASWPVNTRSAAPHHTGRRLQPPAHWGGGFCVALLALLTKR